jgi:hypothetical protein
MTKATVLNENRIRTPQSDLLTIETTLYTARPARRRPRATMELASVPFNGRGASRARHMVRRWQSLVS